jgi:hypothetical protein
MKWLLAVLVVACGDNRRGIDDAALPLLEASVDALVSGNLFGEACVQPPFPEIGACHQDGGACTDEPGGSVCRPWCHVEGVAQCMPRGGVEQITDRGACVCVPRPE